MEKRPAHTTETYCRYCGKTIRGNAKMRFCNSSHRGLYSRYSKDYTIVTKKGFIEETIKKGIIPKTKEDAKQWLADIEEALEVMELVAERVDTIEGNKILFIRKTEKE